MLQVLIGLAAPNDTVFGAIDLEEEQHVMLVNLTAIITLHELIDCILNLFQLILLSTRYNVVWIQPLLALHFCIDPLLLDKLALQQAIVELDLSQTLQVIESGIAKFSQNALQEVCHQIMMVHEDLQQIFDSDDLLGTELEVFVIFTSKVITMGRIVDHGLHNSEGYITHILHRDNPIVVLATTLNHGNVRAGCG